VTSFEHSSNVKKLSSARAGSLFSNRSSKLVGVSSAGARVSQGEVVLVRVGCGKRGLLVRESENGRD